MKTNPLTALRFLGLWACATASLNLVAAVTDYHLGPEASSLEVHVPKAGVFSFAGHEHTIEATHFEGSLKWDPDDPKSGRLEFTVTVKDLAVTDEALSPKNRQKVWDTLVSNAVLKLAEHAEIRFVANSIVATSPRVWMVRGQLEVGGKVGEVRFQADVTPMRDGRMRASGVVPLALKTFAIKPVSALAGTVRTGDTVEVRFDLLAQPASAP